MREVISSRQNPLVKRLAGLSRGRISPREGEYICDGFKLLGDALGSGIKPLCVISAQGVVLPELPVETRHIEVPEALIEAVSPSDTPQGVVFTCETPEDRLVLSPEGRYILLDRMQDPGNVGAILRSAEALGASAALLTRGSADPFGPKAVRAGMGAVFRLPAAFVSIDEVAGSGLSLFAAAAGGSGVRDAAPGPCVLAVGNEGSGLSQEIIKAASGVVSIPMPGGAESLNAAAAAAILMWELFRRE